MNATQARMQGWEIKQLERLARLDPRRAEQALEAIWQAMPDLYGELALMAADQGVIAPADVARLLGCPQDEVESRLLALRSQADHDAETIELRAGVAYVGHVPIWEIVRVQRSQGDEFVRGKFPSLSAGEIEAAFRYAATIPTEIDEQIRRYEQHLARRRSALSEG